MFFLNQYKEQVYYQTINLRQFVHYFWNVFFFFCYIWKVKENFGNMLKEENETENWENKQNYKNISTHIFYLSIDLF